MTDVNRATLIAEPYVPLGLPLATCIRLHELCACIIVMVVNKYILIDILIDSALQILGRA